jgi:apolipoprotein N-acyltransferase
VTSATPEASGDVTHLVWPESAFPFLLHQDPRALAQIAALLPPGVTLITGAARAEENPDALPGEDGWRYYNALQAVGDDGTILGTYDKAHLVPFGEYLPHVLDSAMRSLGIRQFVHIPGGFTPAEARRTFQVRGLPPIAATICYEAIFPGSIVPEGPEPGLILNVTNDAWFGDTPGPRQHFAQARLRAVEEGLPLVRDANTGISGVVDPYGRVVARMEIGREGVLDSGLPRAIAPPPYRRYGDVLFLAMLVCCAATALIARRARRSPHPQPAG